VKVEGLHRSSSSGMASKVFKSFRTFWWIGFWHLQQVVIMLVYLLASHPREIIQFCIDAVQEATEDKIPEPIDYAVLTGAEFRYSQQRTQDIAAEYRFQYPGLMSIFDVFRGRSYSFTKEELELLCLSISTGEFKLDKEASWAMNQDPEMLIDALWRMGFLRAQAVGGIKAQRRSGSSYVGPHQISNLNLRNVPRFQVHGMFRAFLAMKEGREGTSAE
jgi:hypothetical protein